jgi:tetratricopeptide (TPR) repeat protein
MRCASDITWWEWGSATDRAICGEQSDGRKFAGQVAPFFSLLIGQAGRYHDTLPECLVGSKVHSAIEYDDTYAPAYESLGWVLDAFQDDFENAAKYFRLALQHGAGDTARIGLARVLAQTGKTNEAINCLNECRDQTSAEVVKMRQEICEGLWHSESQDKA